MRHFLAIITLSFIALSLTQGMQSVFAGQDGPAGDMDSGNRPMLSGSAQEAIKGAYGREVESETALSSMIGKIIKGSLALLGTIFLILVVYAGYKWMTAAGEEEEVTKAKSIIAEATIGIAVILAAWVITNFVLASLAKTTI